MKKKILISGAGPAGLMFSLLLDKNKFDVTLVERAPTFVDMGYSIILWQRGYKILKKAVNNKNIRKAFPLNKFTIYGGDNMKPLQSSDTTKIGHSIKREHLIKLLSKKHTKKWGKNSVLFSNSIKNIDQENDKCKVNFINGTSGYYDLVVLADGMHSPLRSANFPSKVISQPYSIKYAWIKRGSGLKNEGIVGFMKGYVYLLQTVGRDALLAYYTHSNIHEDNLFISKLKNHFESERNGKFIINTKNSAVFASEEVEIEKPFNGRIVLIGDAYHGHPPTLAMGTSMAFEDADELANLLNTESFDGVDSILDKYAKHRIKKVRYVYGTQKFLEKLSISDSKLELLISEEIIKHGGWKIIEPVLRRTFIN